VIIASGFIKNEVLQKLKKLKKVGMCCFIRKLYRDFELSKMIAEVLGDKKNE